MYSQGAGWAWKSDHEEALGRRWAPTYQANTILAEAAHGDQLGGGFWSDIPEAGGLWWKWI